MLADYYVRKVYDRLGANEGGEAGAANGDAVSVYRSTATSARVHESSSMRRPELALRAYRAEDRDLCRVIVTPVVRDEGSPALRVALSNLSALLAVHERTLTPVLPGR